MVIADSGEGVVCAVFDGHYGPRASEFCRANSVSVFKQALLQKGSAEAPIKKFFQLIEEGWTEHARVLVRRGDWSASMEGTCGLVAHVTPEKLVVGNLGDCRAILVQRETDGSLSALQLTREHNASNPAERERVQKEHPGEDDAVQYVKNSGSWYVRGTLQVSRAIGDLFLKSPEFHDALPAHVKPYVGGELKTPPYVSVTPEVVEHKLEEKDLFLVLATDGLWDELTNKECLESLKGVKVQGQGEGKEGGGPREGPPRGGEGSGKGKQGEQWGWVKQWEDEESNGASKLLWSALRQNPISRRFGIEFLLDLEPGSNRRQVHDDISIVVMWLQPSLRPKA